MYVVRRSSQRKKKNCRIYVIVVRTSMSRTSNKNTTHLLRSKPERANLPSRKNARLGIQSYLRAEFEILFCLSTGRMCNSFYLVRSTSVVVVSRMKAEIVSHFFPFAKKFEIIMNFMKFRFDCFLLQPRLRSWKIWNMPCSYWQSLVACISFLPMDSPRLRRLRLVIFADFPVSR